MVIWIVVAIVAIVAAFIAGCLCGAVGGFDAALESRRTDEMGTDLVERWY